MNVEERVERINGLLEKGYTIWDMGENDLVWLLSTVGEQQREIELLKYHSEQERRINKDVHKLNEFLQENPDLSEHRYGESVSLIALDALKKQQKENARLRKALEEIAECKSDFYGETYADIAIEALEGRS